MHSDEQFCFEFQLQLFRLNKDLNHATRQQGSQATSATNDSLCFSGAMRDGG